MSRPKKNTMEMHIFLPPDLVAWVKEQSKAAGKKKSEFVRKILADAVKEQKTPTITARATPPRGIPIPRPIPAEREEEEGKPWEEYGITKEEWEAIPYEDRQAILRGDGSIIKRR